MSVLSLPVLGLPGGQRVAGRLDAGSTADFPRFRREIVIVTYQSRSSAAQRPALALPLASSAAKDASAAACSHPGGVTAWSDNEEGVLLKAAAAPLRRLDGPATLRWRRSWVRPTWSGLTLKK